MIPLKRLLPAALTAGILAVVPFVRADTTGYDPERVEAYFASVRDAVDAVPIRFGEWSGEDAPIPQAAQRLLRPNASLSRAYVSSVSGIAANVLLVHCRDARDMVGHYPPNCYPSQGWTPGDASSFAADLPYPHTTYAFSRQQSGGGEQQIVIHGMFILPQGRVVPGMDEVRRAEGNNLARPLGAAQVQILFSADIPPDAREAATKDFLEMLRPAIDAILHPDLQP